MEIEKKPRNELWKHPAVWVAGAMLVFGVAANMKTPTAEEQRKVNQHAAASEACGDFRKARPNRYDWTREEAVLAAECKKRGF